jgi:prevent-host-death family protein
MAEAVRVHNRRGELVEAPQYTATEAKHKFGQLLDSALRTGPVAITKQRKPAAVLISLDQYRALTQAEDRALAALSAEFDRQFSQMQAPAAVAAMQRAFDTPAAQLGAFAAASMQTKRVGTEASARKRAPTKRG